MIFLGFWVEPANSVAHFLFYGTKHTFFAKTLVLIGRFGVLIIFLGFWVEPANSGG
jgi:hypothetical protein